jgi:hypothetical protein
LDQGKDQPGEEHHLEVFPGAFVDSGKIGNLHAGEIAHLEREVQRRADQPDEKEAPNFPDQ